MAKYRVTHTDGQVYEVEGPAGATKQEVVSVVRQKLRREENAERRRAYEEDLAKRAEGTGVVPYSFEAEDTDNVIENIYKGIWTGFVHGLETGAIGYTEPLGEETQQSARDTIRNFADAVKPELANPEAVTTKLAQGIGSFASLAPMLLTGPAAFLAVPAFAAAMGVGEASERARAAGATPEERTKAAALGIFPGLLDVIPFAKVSSKFSPVLSDLVQKLGPREINGWGDRILNAVSTGGIEAAQETAQGLVQNAIEKGVYNPDRAILTSEPFEEGAVGFGAGFIIQGLLDAFVGRKRDFDTAPEDAPDTLEGPAQGELFGPAPIPVAPPRASETLLAEQLRAEEDTATEQERDDIRREAAARDPITPLTEEQVDAELEARRQRREEAALGVPAAQLTFADEARRQEALEREPTPEQIDADYTAAEIGRTADEIPTVDTRAEVRRAVEETPTTPMAIAAQEALERELTPEQVQREEARRQREIQEAEVKRQTEEQIAQFEASDEAIPQVAPRTRSEVVTPEAVTPEIEPNIVTAEVLDKLGIPPRAPIRRRIEGKDLNNKGIRDDLVTFAGRAKTSKKATANINSLLAGAPKDSVLPARETTVQEIRNEADTTAAFREPAVGPESRAGRVGTGDITRQGTPPSDTASAVVEDTTATTMGGPPDRADRPDGGTGPLGDPLAAGAVAGAPTGQEVIEALIPQDPTQPAGPQLTAQAEQILDREETAKAADDKKNVTATVKRSAERLTKRPAATTEETTPKKDTPKKDTKGSVLPKSETKKKKVRRTQAQIKAATQLKTESEAKDILHRIHRQRKNRRFPSREIQGKAETYKDPNEFIRQLTDKEIKFSLEWLNKELEAGGLNIKTLPRPSVTRRFPTVDRRTGATTYTGVPLANRRDVGVADEGDAALNRKWTEAEIANLPARFQPVSEAVQDRLLAGNYSTAETLFNPFTTKDMAAINNLLEEGTARNDKEGNAAILYLESYMDGQSVRSAIDPETGRSTLTQESIQNSLKDAVWDTVWGDILNVKAQFRSDGDMTREQVAFFTGKSKEQADLLIKWAEQYISKQGNKWITDELESAASHIYRMNQISPLSGKTPTQLKTQLFINDELADVVADPSANMNTEGRARLHVLSKAINKAATKSLKADALTMLDVPLPPLTRWQLRTGDLVGALRSIGGAKIGKLIPGRISNIAWVYHQHIADADLSKIKTEELHPKGAGITRETPVGLRTKVKIVDNLRDEYGKRIAGQFDPKTNTIRLDTIRGQNIHTLLHETTHALVSAQLADKKNAYTKQMNNLFNEVKGELDSWYGAENVDEFVSEALSNPKFQSTLSRITPKHSYGTHPSVRKGGPVSALRRFYDTVTNMIRRWLGLKTKSPDSALDQVDHLIHGLIAATPEYRNAAAYSLTDNGAPSEVAKSLSDVQGSFPALTNAYRSETGQKVRNFFRGGNWWARLKEFALGFGDEQAVSDIASGYGYGMLGHELHTAVKNMVGSQGTAENYVENTYQKLLRFFGSVTSPSPTTSAQKKAFHDAVYTSTRYQVDPTKPVKTYQDKGKETKKSKIWRDMHKGSWKTVKETKGGVQTYETMRDAWAKMFTNLRDVLYGHIDKLEMTGTPQEQAKAKKELKNDIFKKIFEKARIDPYFPLTRRGDLWLEFMAKDKEGNPEPVYMAFENVPARNDFIAQLKQNPDVDETSIRPYQNAKDAIMNAGKGVPATSFIKKTLNVLNANGVKQEPQIQIMRLFIDVLPESSFAKSLSKRGGEEGIGRAGFIEDSLDAFRSKAFHLAQQTARMEHSNTITNIKDKIQERYKHIQQGREALIEARKAELGLKKNQNLPQEELDYFANIDKRKDQVNAGILERALTGYAEFAVDPPPDALAMQLNRMAFISTIGFNVSSALVNASQIPLFMFPVLNGKYGPIAATAALMRAGSLYSSSGLNRKLPSLMEDGTYEQVDAAPSIDNYFQEHVEVIRDADNKVTKKIYSLKIRPDVRKGLSKERIAELEELAVLTQRMAQEGQLGRSMMYDTVGLQPSGRKRSPYDFVTAGSAWMFHQIERMNRQVANVSVYQLELDRMKKEKLGLDKKATLTPKQRMETKLSNEQYDNAAEEAIYRAQEMNGGAFLATAPRHAQSGWGRVALMYKGYALRMHYTMLKTAWLGYKNARGGDKQKAKEALYQLVGIGGSTVLLAGVQGLPFFGLWTMIANLFLDDDDDDAETIVRKYIGEGWYKGPLTKYSGVDVSTRIGLSNMFLRQNPYAWDALPHERAAEVALGPAFSVYKQMERGYLQLADGEVKRGIETMVPSAFRNVFKVFRWGADDAVLSRRGDVILDDVSTADLVMQFVGFAPREYTLQQEKNVATKRIDKVTSKRRTMLLRRYYISRRMGDSSVSKETRNDIMEFNSKHPQWRISIKDMLKSMKAHRKSSREMVGGISLSPRMRSTLLASQNEYWGEDPFWDE